MIRSELLELGHIVLLERVCFSNDQHGHSFKSIMEAKQQRNLNDIAVKTTLIVGNAQYVRRELLSEKAPPVAKAGDDSCHQRYQA